MVEIPANIPVSLVFARSLDAAIMSSLPRPLVAITPATSNGWNDFGHSFAVVGHIVWDGDQRTPLPVRLMFEGGGYTSTRLLEMLTTHQWLDSAAVPPFVSLLENVLDYRTLVLKYGFEYAVSILRVLGDAGVVRSEGMDNARLALLDGEPFHFGMLRQESSYTSFRRGVSSLRPQPPSQIEDAASSFLMAVSLPSAENRYIIPFNFEPDPLGRDRLSVLIGRNGTGKTQLLLSLIDGLRERTEVPLGARQSSVRFLRRDGENLTFRRMPVARVLLFSSTASDDYPRYLAPWDGIDYEYFSMIGSRDLEFDALTISLIDCLRDDFRVTFNRAAPGDDDESFRPAVGRAHLLKDAIEPLGFWDQVFVPLKQDAQVDLPGLIHANGRNYFQLSRRLNEQRALRLFQYVDPKQSPILFNKSGVRRLSSGETAMFRFAAQAAAAVELGSLLLFDEPETHLHPNFISDFAEVLHRILVASRSAAIVATHSAYLVRETPSGRVNVLTLMDRTIEIGHPRIQTFGASIDSISQAVFQDGAVAHQYQATLIEWLERQSDGFTIEDAVQRFGPIMNRETLSYIARVLGRRGPQ